VQRRRLVQAGLFGLLHLADFGLVAPLSPHHMPRDKHQGDGSVYQQV
jgi:hypothetical protein